MSRSFQAAVLSTCLAVVTLGLSSGRADAQMQISTVTWSGSNSGTSSSWLAGGLAGYNWQRGSMVFGFETDLSAMHLNTNSSGFAGITSGISQQQFFNSTSATIDWYGTVRGRLGVTTGPLLFYGTAGLAYGNVSLSSNFIAANNQTNGGVITPTGAAALALNQQTSGLRAGWVVGAGVEYLVRPDVSLTLGYQYVDLGTLNLAGSGSYSGLYQWTSNQAANANAHFNVVTAGLSWHFGAPSSASSAYASMTTKAPPLPPSNPWAGVYVGGRAGGAWGNPANANTSASAVGGNT
jgi:outer membrane immunogenic protein